MAICLFQGTCTTFIYISKTFFMFFEECELIRKLLIKSLLGEDFCTIDGS